MKRKIFMISAFILMIIGIIYSNNIVGAVTSVKVNLDADKTYICYNKDTGKFEGSYKGTDNKCVSTNSNWRKSSVKMIGNDLAYCVNWNLVFKGSDYEEDTTWKKNSKNAIMAGYIMNEVNKKGYSAEKAYARTGATLNTLFATVVKDARWTPGSRDFSKDTEIAGYINGASKYYNDTVRLVNSLPDVEIKVEGDSKEGSILNYKGTDGTDGYYYSNKITVSGFKKSFGGDTVKYVLTAKTKDGTVLDICTDDKRSSCEKSGIITIDDEIESDQIYYLFVDANKVDSTDVIAFEVKSSNKSTYYSSSLYKDSKNQEAQRVIKKIEFDVSRSNSNAYSFSIPNLVGHQISAYKVDEDGNEICGATLEIYRDDPTASNVDNRIATNIDDDDNDNCRITYKPDSSTEENDDFYSHDYYLIERSAPDGFVLVDTVRHFYEKDSREQGDKATITCVNSNGEKVDDEYCYPENYAFMCRSNIDSSLYGPIKPNENCPSEQQGQTGGPTLNGEGEGTDGTEITPNALPGENGVEPNAAYEKVCYNIKNPNNMVEVNDATFCNGGSYSKIWNGLGNITVRQENVRNVVNISKMDVTGNKEVIGAELKVCTKASYDEKGNDCDTALTIDGIKMEWVSDDVPHSIYRIKVGEYYIVETVPPVGYLKATTAVKFSIDKYGKVITGDKTITNDDFVNNGGVIVIDNKITEFTISKRDMATSKELPGATLSICQSYRDNETNELHMKVNQYTGECIEAVRADGESATWKSTKEEKRIRGLNPGTYYLVEKIAPTDYTLAESIIFTLKEDGTLADKDGKPIDDNKIIMLDKPLENKETGSLDIYLVIGIGLGVVGIGLGTYYYLNRSKVNNIVKNKLKRKNKVDKD